MKERIERTMGFLVGIGIVLIAVFTLMGCSAGVRDLGTALLRDGTQIQFIQVGSEGQDGPKVVAIEGYIEITNANGTTRTIKVSEYVASGQSLTSVILQNTGAAALLSSGHVGGAAIAAKAAGKVAEITAKGNVAAAAATRPDTTSVNTVVDSSGSNVNTAAAAAVATSTSTSSSDQTQLQGQLQGQQQGAIIIVDEDGGCQGNCEDNGPH